MNSEKLSQAQPNSISQPESKEFSFLNSDSAKNILPNLSLEKLSDDEKNQIFELSDEVTSFIDRQAESTNSNFDLHDKLHCALANITRDFEPYKNEGIISPKLQEANKLFCATLLESANLKNDNDYTWKIYDNCFSGSPNMASYCGGLSDSLELLTIAERSQLANNPLSRDIYDEIIYDTAFSHDNDFEKILTNTSTKKQIQLIPIVFNISERCHPDDWDNRVIDNVSRAFTSLAESTESPLIRTFVESLGQKIDQRIYDETNFEWIDVADNPEYADIIAENNNRRNEILEQQGDLHQIYSKLPENQFIVKIAPDVAASTTANNNLTSLSDVSGHQTMLLNLNSRNDFNLSNKDVLLLTAAHNFAVKDIISGELEIDLANIPLDSQLQLLNFMAEANNDRYDKLCKTLRNVDGDLRQKIVENFVAADFGPDFGDKLLEIAESDKFTPEQKTQILNNISTCRESVENITGLYQKIDNGNFSKQFARAANERLTDAITTFQSIAKTGSATADLGWPGQSTFNSDSALEALDYTAKSFQIASGTFQDVLNNKSGASAKILLRNEDSDESPNARLNRTVYDLYSPDYGHLLVYTRSEGSSSFDKAIEYGNRNGVEASISMIVDPLHPHSPVNPYKSPNNVSILRLDREGHAPDIPASEARERNNMAEIGTISNDIAAIGDRPDTPSGKIARLLSVGNRLRAKSESEAHLNHNTRWFEQEKYGTASGFKEIVDYFDNSLANLCRLYKQRQQAIKLGQKALRQTAIPQSEKPAA